ncbi:hypothetical protein GCM10022268_10190 [Sphingomonas cynarae]|uniref:Uncharacterized protein n=2 Tax=Sphingomonas cynarae TaxID=930197 RepID=A0ABP7DCC4_9SPHN
MMTIVSDHIVAWRSYDWTDQVAPRTEGGSILAWPQVDDGGWPRPSAEWPIDHIRAPGSEHIWRAWDDRRSPDRDDFVYEAQMDMKSDGVFRCTTLPD